MHKLLISTGLTVLLTAGSLFAQFSGIGVSRLFLGQEIEVSWVEDGHVTRDDTIFYEGRGGKVLTSLTINTHGTHIAFIQEAKVEDVRTLQLVVTRADQQITAQKAITLDMEKPENNERIRLYWPQGDWVYFTHDADPEEAGSQHIWRVDVQTGQQQDCMIMSERAIRLFGMSWDAKWMYGRGVKSGENGFPTMMVRIPDLDNATLPVTVTPEYILSGSGCGHTMGPSGTIISSGGGSGHTQRFVRSVDTTTGDETKITQFTSEDYDSRKWCTDPENYWLRLIGENTYDTVFVGGGYNESVCRFAVNSDEWNCLMIGWEGRFCNAGCNNVVINWKDSLSLNVSKITPCRQQGGVYIFEGTEGCDKTSVNAMAFWLGSPTDEIIEPLRDDARAENRLAYRVSGLDDDADISDVAYDMPTKERRISAMPRYDAGTIYVDMRGRIVPKSALMHKSSVPAGIAIRIDPVRGSKKVLRVQQH